MAFNIRDFSAHIKKYGTLQTNRFEVSLTTPKILIEKLKQLDNITPINSAIVGEHIRLRAEQVRIPGIDIQTIDNMPQGTGLTEAFPTNVRFTDTTITFIDNQSNDLYKYFYFWKNYIVDYSGLDASISQFNPLGGSYEVSYRNDYISQMDIDIFDHLGILRSRVKLFEVFPKSVNEVSLSWGENNTLFKISVSFKSKYWRIERSTDTNLAGIPFSTDIITLGSRS